MTPSRIASARVAAGLTQHELAKQVGVSVDTVRRAEHAKHQTRITTLIRIARVCDVSLESLVPDEPTRT